jgi:hypothetical protein
MSLNIISDNVFLSRSAAAEPQRVTIFYQFG